MINTVTKSRKGFSLIEVVIGVSIIVITLIGLISTYNLFLEASFKNTKKIQAYYLLEEGVEALRSIRDEGWGTNISGIPTNTSRGLSYNGTKWVVNSSVLMTDGVFFRDFKVFDVYRDAQNDISSSGTLDSNTKLFTVNVSWWEGAATTTKSVSFYLANIF
jgi:Tfp pilus assembly protein PilV